MKAFFLTYMKAGGRLMRPIRQYLYFCTSKASKLSTLQGGGGSCGRYVTYLIRHACTPHTPSMHTSYATHAHLIRHACTPHTPRMHTSYATHAHLIRHACIPHTLRMHTSCGVGGSCGRYVSVPLCVEATVFLRYSAAIQALLTRY
jgi:hypothetical protein